MTDVLTPKQMARKFTRMVHWQDPGRSFSDFIEMAFHSLAKNARYVCGERGDILDAHEAEYMKIVARYEARDSLDTIRKDFPEMLANVLMQVSNGGLDYLGECAGELEALNSFMGQFFTPYAVCKMMALMTGNDLPKTIEKKGFVTLSEPASGAGAMVLAYADMVEDAGKPLRKTMFAECRDLSDLAFRMCFIQMEARGVPALCIRGDTLSGDPDRFVMERIFTSHYRVFHHTHGSPFAARPVKIRHRERRAVQPVAKETA